MEGSFVAFIFEGGSRLRGPWECPMVLRSRFRGPSKKGGSVSSLVLLKGSLLPSRIHRVPVSSTDPPVVIGSTGVPLGRGGGDGGRDVYKRGGFYRRDLPPHPLKSQVTREEGCHASVERVTESAGPKGRSGKTRRRWSGTVHGPGEPVSPPDERYRVVKGEGSALTVW